MKLDKRKGLAIALVITLVYVLVTIQEVRPESDSRFPDYTQNVKPFLDHCKIDDMPERVVMVNDGSYYTMEIRSPMKWWLVCVSHKTFGNENMIPFLASVGILFLTYQIAFDFTKKPLPGLVAMAMLVTSNTFTRWDTSATYDQFWVLFLLASIVSIKRIPLASPILFSLSIVSKGIGLLYAPSMILTILKQHDEFRGPLILIFSAVLGILGLIVSAIGFGGSFEFSPADFLHGIMIWPNYFFYDYPVMFLPAVIVLLFNFRHKIENAGLVAWWQINIILGVPIILGFTDQLVHPYRFVPLIVFFGIGVGMIIQYYITKIQQKRLVTP